ncbi:MAG: hypothetical protein H0Z33_04355 [Bacillaceae bacterium]|nr:hypothetical protein [Bacillaceae bacterium]
MMFKITYLLQQKYKSRIIGDILSWQYGKLEIRDREKRIFTLREEQIVSIIPEQKRKIEHRHTRDDVVQPELFDIQGPGT